RSTAASATARQDARVSPAFCCLLDLDRGGHRSRAARPRVPRSHADPGERSSVARRGGSRRRSAAPRELPGADPRAAHAAARGHAPPDGPVMRHRKAPQRNLELLERLTDARVEFCIIGGIAAVLHGATRTTVDLDIAAPFTEENLKRLL